MPRWFTPVLFATLALLFAGLVARDHVRNQGRPLESLRELENGLAAFPFLDEERRALFEEYLQRWRAEARAAGLAA